MFSRKKLKTVCYAFMNSVYPHRHARSQQWRQQFPMLVAWSTMRWSTMPSPPVYEIKRSGSHASLCLRLHGTWWSIYIYLSVRDCCFGRLDFYFNVFTSNHWLVERKLEVLSARLEAGTQLTFSFCDLAAWLKNETRGSSKNSSCSTSTPRRVWTAID